jgi:TM2 domain-containing membrane protein YozV
MATVIAALRILGAALCALSPGWGARGYHRTALGCAFAGAALALAAALILG